MASVLPARPMTRRTLLGGALAGGLALAAARPAFAADGPHIESLTWLDDRQVLARVSTPVLRQPADVRVLLPASYASSPTRRYPVLYLLHGSDDDANAWVDKYGARPTLDTQEIITVMPDGGHGGWYVDHPYSTVGPVNWPIFHCQNLVGLVDENLRTLPWWSARAIAGFSMGGFGAALYGGRFPTLFRSVSCYSGATDAYSMDWRSEMYDGPHDDGENYGSIYGTEVGSEDGGALWRNNPASYASALVDRRVRLYAGSSTGGFEDKIRPSTLAFHSALVAAGARDTSLTLIPGDHTADTAVRALAADLPGICSTLLRPQDG